MSDNFNLSGGSRKTSQSRGGRVDNKGYDQPLEAYMATRAGAAGGGDNRDLAQNDELIGGVGSGGLSQQMRGMNLHGSGQKHSQVSIGQHGSQSSPEHQASPQQIQDLLDVSSIFTIFLQYFMHSRRTLSGQTSRTSSR